MIIWTAEMINFFSELCQDDKLTFRAIMEMMNAKFGSNLSRNACIGKARRLKVPPRAPTNNLVLRLEGVPLEKLHSRTCRWPLGLTMQRPPYRYCGKLTISGRPYCKTHAKKARSSSTYSAKTSLPV